MTIFRKHHILAALLALVLVLALAGCGSAKPVETAAPTERPDNPAYTQIFQDRGILHVESPAFMNEVASFALVMEDGSVDAMACYYEDDVIQSLYESVYLDVEGADEAELNGVREYLEGTVQQINSTGLAEADWGEGPRFYRLTIYMNDLNSMTHARELADAGLLVLDNPNVDYLSMKDTRDGLLESGYVEK